MGKPPSSNWRILLDLCGVVGLMAIVVAATLHFRHHPAPEGLNVPLGVEQAAIVTYSGPLVTVAPYKWGVAVNVRIAQVSERDASRVYDVRYIVNRAGAFDLKDYLVAANGDALDGLPSFKFTGDPKLSKNLDKRIQETEENRIEVGGRYYETLSVLAVLWIVWLLLLIFYKRPKPPAEPDAAPPGPTLAETMRSLLVQLEAGALDAAAKAKLEMTMLQCWRRELVLGEAPMISVLDRIARHEKTGEPLRKLQHWLYHPASTVPPAEIAAIMAAYTREPEPTEVTAPS
jgi:hypothetical protein